MPLTCLVDFLPGDANKKNWVFYYPGDGSEASAKLQTVVFFPGDISDFTDGICNSTSSALGAPNYHLEALFWVMAARRVLQQIEILSQMAKRPQILNAETTSVMSLATLHH